jgi:hypothetical protein
MRSAKQKRMLVKPPVVGPGNWHGEILGGGTVNFGQVVQHNPGRQSVEFSYLVIPAIFTPPEAQFTWPGIVLVFAPTPMKTVRPDAGHLRSAKHLLSLSLSLEVTREQFSDLFGMFEASRVRDLQFTVEDGADGSWPVHSWGISAGLQRPR